MAAKFGVDKAPAVLMICNGDPSTAERYEGEFKSGPIRDFISKYAGGRKCASAVKVTSLWLQWLLSSPGDLEPSMHSSPETVDGGIAGMHILKRPMVVYLRLKHC